MSHANSLATARIVRSRLGLALTSVVFSVALLFVLCAHFDPRWETNDDVAMSMVAHGYGIAAFGSPNILFSNVLWGGIVRSMPSVHGVLGYSIATLLALFVSSCSIVYFLTRVGNAPWISMIVACLLLCRPVLFPQFTLTSGLLAVSSVLALNAYAHTRSTSSLIGSALLAFLAFLIRSQEFGFVMLVALPIFVARRLHRDMFVLRVGAILLLAILAAGVWDHHCYSSAAWHRFAELDAARAPFTDFGVAQKVRNSPELMKRFGYSPNDIELLGSFFFVDPTIFVPAKLHGMVSGLGTVHLLTGNGKAAINSIGTLLSPEVLPVVALAAILFVIEPSVELACGWLFFLLALFAMGLAGRGGLLRVELPVASLLCATSINSLRANVNAGRRGATFKRAVFVAALISSLGYAMYVLYPQAVRAAQHTKQVQAAAGQFPNEPVVAWGAGLEFESLFPLLAHDSRLRAMKIYPLGVFTYAPFSVSAAEEMSGQGFIERIRSEQGLLMLATPNVKLLETWCRERFGGVLQGKTEQAAPYVQVDRLWCVNK